MPTAPRSDKKAKKIAFKILGVPANMKDQETPKKKKINKRLVFEETIRVR